MAGSPTVQFKVYVRNLKLSSEEVGRKLQDQMSRLSAWLDVLPINLSVPTRAKGASRVTTPIRFLHQCSSTQQSWMCSNVLRFPKCSGLEYVDSSSRIQ